MGSERLKTGEYLRRLNGWADAVACKTEDSWRLYHQSPTDFESSEAYFRMLVLVTVLQRDLGVGYATDTLDDDYDCTDSRLMFLHGVLEGRGGTCATLPVLYVAIGRRLGYPLFLVRAREHLFVRWSDPESGERFNIEATSPGLNVRDDEHYLTWPIPIDPQAVQRGWLLRSMDAREEEAEFCSFRAQCLGDWTQYNEAVRYAQRACDLAGEAGAPRYRFLWSLLTVLRAAAVQAGLCDRQPTQSATDSPWAIEAIGAARQEVDRLARIHAQRRRAGAPGVPLDQLVALQQACEYGYNL